MAEHPGYFAAHAGLEEERSRLDMLEARGDSMTTQRMLGLGVEEGWRCLEVGAGGGSVARWLGERVGSGGRVVATDIDTRFLDDQDLANVEVRQHDIVADDLESDTYDLAHCRSVLGHLSDPEAALRKMAAALRPGGWLLAEEFDYTTLAAINQEHPLAAGFNRAVTRTAEALDSAGIVNAYFGRRVPGLLRELGMANTGNQAITAIIWGGSSGALLQKQTFARVRQRLVDSGAFTDAEVTELDRAMDDPSFGFMSSLMVVAWGRRPT